MLTQLPLNSSIVKVTASKVFSLAPCTLTWHDRKLFVRAASLEESLDLEALQDSDRLVECLRRSPVEFVKLDASLDNISVVQWAEACGQAKKACYVNVPSVSEILSQPNPVFWFLKKSIHRATAIGLALALTPALVLGIAVFKLFDFKLQRQWAVGDRGRLFQMWVYLQPIDRSNGFCTIQSFLLRLVNVIQGELLLGESMPTSLNQGLS